MSPKQMTVLMVGVSLSALSLVPVDADEGREKRLRARLSGAEEVPTVSSTGRGSLRATINADDSEVSYELAYEGLEGAVTQAHIHLGQTAVNGGIMIWLCGTAALPGPAGTPACPEPGGVVGRTVAAADVIGPAGQGVAAGEFAEALRAIRRGLAYANVHSTKHPGGEIRGQINEPVN
jgi:hypothetical protein